MCVQKGVNVNQMKDTLIISRHDSNIDYSNKLAD